jgi:RND family efflux transporter MFP subunit
MSPEHFIRIIAGAFVLLAAGCGRNGASTQQPPPPAVTVAPVEQQDITESEEFTGRTEAVEAVEVRPRVSGYVEEVHFQSGQLVRKGDLLFVIDPRVYKAEVDRRAAEYEQAKALLANADRDARRAQGLLKTRAISSEETDAKQAQFEESQAAMLAAGAILESARLNLEYTEVRAPIDGRVSRALLTAGNYVSGNAGQASLLTTIVSVDPIYVYADVEESALLHFNALARAREAANAANAAHPGRGGDEAPLPVDLGFADEEGFPHHGHVESFDNRLDANTGTIVLRATFPNPDGRIVPGLFARIQVPTSGKHPAVLVDETAIGTDQAQQYVLALGPHNVAEYRAVQLGAVMDGRRIVRSGLQPGEKIIVNGLQRVRAGMPVTPQELAPGNPREPSRQPPARCKSKDALAGKFRL